MNLEVGMYCYNKTNRKLGIGQIISFQSNNNVNVRYKNDIELVNIGNIKASNNIIDLIEVGDYVNGYLINEIYDIDKGRQVYHGAHDMLDEIGFYNKNIKTILTKEQFENNCYKIGDE